MKKHYAFAFALLTLVATAALAASAPCSIHPKKGTKKEDLAPMAKISQDDAQKAAMASFKDSSKATVKEAELEVEHGCLIYSFDIAIEGKSGVQEVQVDAGTGKVLSSKHESPKKEAAEKAKDKAAAPKS